MSRATACSAAASSPAASAKRAAPPNLLPCDGAAFLYPDALPQGDADRLLAQLRDAIEWRQEVATLMGRRVAIPRLTAWHGAAGYVYSGIRMTPLPWTPPLLELKALAEALAGHPFNSVLLNLYRDGRDSVSWHADNEPGLGRDPVIASLSLGAVRRFQLKHRRSPLRVALDLPHGSCLIMAGATQHHWLHQLPKTARPVGPRINLTFRRMG
jgi:alkylated DNA repair dioxygenase AlkB